jgi:protein-disulfide isomerase
VLLTIPEITKNYIDTGKVRYIFKDFPLSFHPNAQKAAEAAHCAGEQGAYWAMHDKLFSAQGAWSGLAEVTDTFAGYAGGMGLDVAAFRACLESGKFAAQIAQEVREGQAAGVGGTPSFLINGQLMVGAYPYSEFQRRIEAELAK